MKHVAEWTAPPPFWDSDSEVSDNFHRPRILRFATDAFMEDVMGVLSQDPRGLPALEAEAETWRGPSNRSKEILRSPPPENAGMFENLRRKLAKRAGAPVMVPPNDKALKLYQAAHQRHYLVAAALVCQRPGLPDRKVDKQLNQSVSMLVRRLVPTAPMDAKEYALGPSFDSDGIVSEGWMELAFQPGEIPLWVKPTNPHLLASREERLGLFPSSYLEADDRHRRLFMGYVPVGRRETYQNAGLDPASDPDADTTNSADPRIALLDKLVIGPWMAHAEGCFGPGGGPLQIFDSKPEEQFSDTPEAAVNARKIASRNNLRQLRSNNQIAAWSILAELYQLLEDHGRADVQAALSSGRSDATCLAPLRTVRKWDSVNKPAGIVNPANWPCYADNLADALVRMGKVDKTKNPPVGNLASLSTPKPEAEENDPFPGESGLYPPSVFAGKWPDFLFLLADPLLGPFPNRTGNLAGSNVLIEETDKLRGIILGLLEPEMKVPPTSVPAIPSRTKDAWYTIRLAMIHPECSHHTEVLSAPTTPFQLASYFDSSAPARPIKIGLPVDPTLEGLRKADRNTIFMLSDTMCNQISRMKGIGFVDLVLSVLPWPFHKDLPKVPAGDCKKGDDLGMMLVVSIPIITICALIILIIMVALLDYVFKWLPFFMFWVPVKKGKSELSPPEDRP